MKLKLKLKAIKNINNDILNIYEIIYGSINRINDSYHNNIITKYKYSTYLQSLEYIVQKLENINYPFSIKNNKFSIVRKNIDNIISQLNKLCINIGCKTIFDIIYLVTKIKSEEYYDKKELIHFINKTFNPYNYKIIEHSKIDLKLLNADINEIDMNDIKYYPLKKSLNLLNYINGSIICIPFKKLNLSIVIEGYFIKDTLNIYKKINPLNIKYANLYTEIENLNINKCFKYGYIEQFSLCDFIIYTNDELIKKCNDSYNEILNYKEKTISVLVKNFLNMSIEKQRDFLTLFLLMKEDLETQYLAHLLYDMISNESYLLKPQPLAEQIYDSLHWNVQKLFKIAIQKTEIYNKNLLNFQEDNIAYEKRIALMKTTDHVKSKAMEKYKEIVNKGNDNSSKAQQYLDGILKIPFNVYLKEDILVLLDNYKVKLNTFIETLTHSKQKPKLVKYIENYNQSIKSKEIDIFLKNLESVIVDNNNINETKLNSYYKINEIYNIVGKMNLYLDNKHKINIKSPIKKKKKDIIKLIIEKKKYITNVNLSKIECFNLKNYQLYKNTIKEWCDYKDEIKNYISNVDTILNDAVYSQTDAKIEIKRIIAQWINGEMCGYCFGFEGPPGTGKTSLAKKGISKCLVDAKGTPRPFAFIPIGGSTNGATFEGHGYTYVGSTWGKIVDILRDTQCMNPIIYIDELDKISNTENGREIIGILTHMTDFSQNDEFFDKYFSGVKIDLSKVLFIFSYNDYSSIDAILADRIHRVKFKNLSKKEKLYIINNYIMPEFLEVVGFPKKSIIFDNGVIEYIIDNYTFEAGIRKLKQKIFEIIREINLRYITNTTLYDLPIVITKKIVNDIFSKKTKIILKKIPDKSHIGLVNGLYATMVGSGGITVIEVFKTPCDNKLGLTITGQQGDVMKESVQCAKTVAWNILPKEIKQKIIKNWKDKYIWGLHIHCPEAATPKDGPSAGGAITLALISLLCNIPVKNTIALTGEIDLNGSIHVIGGLENKIEGGKMAGVKTLLYPYQNEQDIEIIRKTRPEILEDITIKPICNIWEILDECLEENKLEFNKYI